MARSRLRLRIDETGCLEVVDPGFDCLSLLRSIDPGFEIRRARLPGFFSPRFLGLREVGCLLPASRLLEETEELLWNAHRTGMMRLAEGKGATRGKGEASLLDLKVEIVRRMLSECQLCGKRCGVDRLNGQLGACLLGTEGMVAEHFVQIAEEAPINPSLMIHLAGCGLKCRYCQQSWLLDPLSVIGEKFSSGLWSRLCLERARSLTFVGGNPDESLYAILRFLRAAPVDWRLPVVWNCHGYATPETIALLDGVVDAYVPDFKYGSDACGLRLSGVPGYPAMAGAAISFMLAQGVPVFVRILVLPGHFDCCHLPVVDYLASVKKENLLVSVRGQYCPDWMITNEDGLLVRRPTEEEVAQVQSLVGNCGLQSISNGHRGLWE